MNLQRAVCLLIALPAVVQGQELEFRGECKLQPGSEGATWVIRSAAELERFVASAPAPKLKSARIDWTQSSVLAVTTRGPAPTLESITRERGQLVLTYTLPPGPATAGGFLAVLVRRPSGGVLFREVEPATTVLPFRASYSGLFRFPLRKKIRPGRTQPPKRVWLIRTAGELESFRASIPKKVLRHAPGAPKSKDPLLTLKLDWSRDMLVAVTRSGTVNQPSRVLGVFPHPGAVWVRVRTPPIDLRRITAHPIEVGCYTAVRVRRCEGRLVVERSLAPGRRFKGLYQVDGFVRARAGPGWVIRSAADLKRFVGGIPTRRIHPIPARRTPSPDPLLKPLTIDWKRHMIVAVIRRGTVTQHPSVLDVVSGPEGVVVRYRIPPFDRRRITAHPSGLGCYAAVVVQRGEGAVRFEPVR